MFEGCTKLDTITFIGDDAKNMYDHGMTKPDVWFGNSSLKYISFNGSKYNIY